MAASLTESVTSAVTYARTPAGARAVGLFLVVFAVLQAVPSILQATTRTSDWSDDPSPSQPAGSAFGVAWFTLYTLMAVTVFLVVRSPASTARTALLALLALQVALNWAWIPTWGQGERKAATYLIVAMLAALAPTLVLSTGTPRHRWAGACLSPLAAWLMFALILSSERNTMDGAEA